MAKPQTALVRIPLNPNAPIRQQRILTRNGRGRYVVEPAKQARGSHDSCDAGVFLRDLYGDYPADVKLALRRELSALAA